MRDATRSIDKPTERAIRTLLKSRAESRIYLFLLRKNGARTEEIIKGTKLHPSTVRELLSKMHHRRLIYRIKLKNDCIGKNPYLYHATSPIQLLQKYIGDMEEQLNKIANLGSTKRSHIVTINIVNQAGEP